MAVKKNKYGKNFLTEIKRIDDLRIASDDLQKVEIRRIDEQLALHSLYEDKLALAEQKRLDAIRSVDTASVSTAADRAAVQAQVLAKNVTESAETLRQLVATTANSVAEQLKTISTQLADRLLVVEKAQYELKGKTGVTDPIYDELLSEVKALKISGSTHSGRETGMKELWGYIVGIIGLGVLLLSAFKVI